MQEVFKNSEVGTDSCKELWARVVRCPLGHFQVKIISSLEFRAVIFLELLHTVLEVQDGASGRWDSPRGTSWTLFSCLQDSKVLLQPKCQYRTPLGAHSSIRQDYNWPFSASFSFFYVFPEVTHKDF